MLAARLGGLTFEAIKTPDQVTHNHYDVVFSAVFGAVPALFGAMQSFDGPDPAHMRQSRAVDVEGVQVFVEEETCSDADLAHTTETVGILAIAKGAMGIPAPGAIVAPAATEWQSCLFGADYSGWTSNVGRELRVTSCGIIGEMLGGYDILGAGAWVEKSYNLTDQSHSSVSISLTFVKIDSWDGERGIVMVDGREVWSRPFSVNEGSQHCGQANGWHERDFPVGPVPVVHSADTLVLRVTSSLNQGASDESFAIADVLVEVHSSCLRGECIKYAYACTELRPTRPRS